MGPNQENFAKRAKILENGKMGHAKIGPTVKKC